jgi:S-phase kinase-associated protein 1
MNTVTLQSKDGQTFNVTEETARRFVTVKNLLDDSLGGIIPLPEVEAKTLEKVLQYTREPEGFFTTCDTSMLISLICTTNYFEFKELLDLAVHEVAISIKGKTPQEIREHFGIVSDFTPEEEEQVRKENEWVEEK